MARFLENFLAFVFESLAHGFEPSVDREIFERPVSNDRRAMDERSVNLP